MNLMYNLEQEQYVQMLKHVICKTNNHEIKTAGELIDVLMEQLMNTTVRESQQHKNVALDDQQFDVYNVGNL